MTEENKEQIKEKPNKPNLIQYFALIIMLVLLVASFFYYKEIKEFNNYPKNPCNYCMALNKNVVCSAIGNKSGSLLLGNNTFFPKTIENVKNLP